MSQRTRTEVVAVKRKNAAGIARFHTPEMTAESPQTGHLSTAANRFVSHTIT
jgi:hypothetical protein